VDAVKNDDRADWKTAFSWFPGQVAYVWHAGVTAHIVAAGLEGLGLIVRAQIIWKKTHPAISRGHYHWGHEPCWYAVRKGSSAKWSGDRCQTTVWQLDNGLAKEDKTEHSTQKPVECMARPIRNHGSKDDHVYEPFMGSGTTLVAAEKVGRQCFGVELDPGYCDVAVQRWENLTGKKAKRES
jgi:DNA modification methylase